MPQQWTPFRNYANYHHVLGAGFCFVHPGNGNIYGWACEQLAGKRQNLVIYRSVGGAAPVPIVTFEGAEDAESFIERGGCVIGHGGALWVATSLQPKGVAFDAAKRTGFEGVWCRIPGIDDPWSLSGLEQRLTDIETALGNLASTPGPKGDKGDQGGQGEQGNPGAPADPAALAALAGQVELLELAVEGLVSGGLSVEQAEDLAWVGRLRTLLKG
jgi:hypothetical protein